MAGRGVSNPSLRLFSYNRSAGQLTDYLQYQLSIDLDPATLNNMAAADGEEEGVEWSLVYSATQFFNTTDLSVASFQNTMNKFTKPTDELFQAYVRHYSTNSKSIPDCATLCWRHHICAMRHVDYTAFDECLDSLTPATDTDSYDYSNILSLDSDYDVLDDDDVTGLKGPPVYMKEHTDDPDRHVDWKKISGSRIDSFGNPMGDDEDPDPPCPSWSPHCQHQYPVPMTQYHPSASYVYVLVYALVGLLVFSVVLITILCCFWPRHNVFSSEPRYTAVKTSDTVEAGDVPDTVGTDGYY